MQDHVEISTSYRLISHLRCLFFFVCPEFACLNHGPFLGTMTDGAETLQNMLYIFLAFPKCLAQLQSFSIGMVAHPTQSDGLLWARLPVAAPVVATTFDSSITLPGVKFDDASPKTLYIITPLITEHPIFEVTSNSLWRWCNSCHEYYRIFSMMPTPSMPGDVSRAFVL